MVWSYYFIKYIIQHYNYRIQNNYTYKILYPIKLFIDKKTKKWRRSSFNRVLNFFLSFFLSFFQIFFLIQQIRSLFCWWLILTNLFFLWWSTSTVINILLWKNICVFYTIKDILLLFVAVNVFSLFVLQTY